MHEVQGSFCKTAILRIKNKITEQGKNPIGLNLKALLAQPRGGCGGSHWAKACWRRERPVEAKLCRGEAGPGAVDLAVDSIESTWSSGHWR